MFMTNGVKTEKAVCLFTIFLRIYTQLAYILSLLSTRYLISDMKDASSYVSKTVRGGSFSDVL